jgi:glycerate kinase
MSAATVAAAMAEGVASKGGVPDVCPVADGGEGTLESLRATVGGNDVLMTVTAPDGREIRARYLLSQDSTTAVVETASASGLHLIDPKAVDAYAATSAGTGQLIAAAARAGARTILVGVGGSGFSDGGKGALDAIASAGGLNQTRLVVMCDVTTPYEDAARVFGPQKGADPDTVLRLTERLDSIARRLPRDPRGVDRTGAAGGLAGALWAAYDARLVSGIDTVLERLGFQGRLAQADIVITGEGRLDAQTAHGKVISGILRWAGIARVPVHAVVGQCAISRAEVHALGLVDAVEAGDEPGLARAAARITGHTHAPHRSDSTTNQEVNK